MNTDTSFSGLGLADPLLRALADVGYTSPTPIQAKAIPVVMAGHDVMAAAQTGTGKTAGFALPIINALMPLASHSASPARHPVRALIIAPTRELADQIHDNVKTYIQFTPLRSAAVFGGVDMQPQTNALRAGVEILIATPGRLLDHVQQKSVNLSQVQLLVLDEADRMLDMGFLPDIQRIINLLNPRRQNLMFSATFSDEIRKLAKRFLNEPKLIEVARPNTLAENVEHDSWCMQFDSWQWGSENTQNMRVKLGEITSFNRIVPRVVWTWSNLVDNDVISCRKHFHAEGSRQLELFCDSHRHGFGFFDQTIRNASWHNGLRQNVVSVDIFLNWENCHVLAIS